MLILTVNCKIQGLFNAFEWFSSTFEGKVNFQGDSPVYPSTFQACVNPVQYRDIKTSNRIRVKESLHIVGTY